MVRYIRFLTILAIMATAVSGNGSLNSVADSETPDSANNIRDSSVSVSSSSSRARSDSNENISRSRSDYSSKRSDQDEESNMATYRKSNIEIPRRENEPRIAENTILMTPPWDAEVKKITSKCLECICQAASNCKTNHDDGRLDCPTEKPFPVNGPAYGPFKMTKPYWEDAGSLTSTKKSNRNQFWNLSQKDTPFVNCANDVDCARRSVKAYMARYPYDCNGDGIVNCTDYAAVHIRGPYDCHNSLPSAYNKRFLKCWNSPDSIDPNEEKGEEESQPWFKTFMNEKTTTENSVTAGDITDKNSVSTTEVVERMENNEPTIQTYTEETSPPNKEIQSEEQGQSWFGRLFNRRTTTEDTVTAGDVNAKNVVSTTEVMEGVEHNEPTTQTYADETVQTSPSNEEAQSTTETKETATMDTDFTTIETVITTDINVEPTEGLSPTDGESSTTGPTTIGYCTDEGETETAVEPTQDTVGKSTREPISNTPSESPALETYDSNVTESSTVKIKPDEETPDNVLEKPTDQPLTQGEDGSLTPTEPSNVEGEATTIDESDVEPTPDTIQSTIDKVTESVYTTIGVETESDTYTEDTYDATTKETVVKGTTTEKSAATEEPPRQNSRESDVSSQTDDNGQTETPNIENRVPDYEVETTSDSNLDYVTDNPHSANNSESFENNGVTPLSINNTDDEEGTRTRGTKRTNYTTPTRRMPPKIVDITDECIHCICEAMSSCEPGFYANPPVYGPFHITERYWKDVGSFISEKSNNSSFVGCVNDMECAEETVKAYMAKYRFDCNGDGVVDCDDYVAIHINGPSGCQRPLPADYETRYLKCIQRQYVTETTETVVVPFQYEKNRTLTDKFLDFFGL